MSDPLMELDRLNNLRQAMVRQVILPCFEEWWQRVEGGGLSLPRLEDVRPEVSWDGRADE